MRVQQSDVLTGHVVYVAQLIAIRFDVRYGAYDWPLMPAADLHHKTP